MKKKFLAEMIGTMVLVLLGCGAAVFNKGGVGDAAWVVTVAFAFGLSVVAMAYTVGSVSGCHINPAITLGVWLSGRMKGKEAGFYMIAQVIGALIGSGILFAIVHSQGASITGGVTTTGANGFDAANLVPALIAETVFTCIFVLVVLGATDGGSNTTKFAGLAIGLALVLIHIDCIPVTGTSVNPARSIGPAIFDLFEGGTAINQLWVFIVAPFAGAALASGLWNVLKVKK